MSPMSEALKHCQDFPMVREYIRQIYWSKSHKTPFAREHARKLANEAYSQLNSGLQCIAMEAMAILRRGYPRKGF